MFFRQALRLGPTCTWLDRYPPEMLQHIGAQVEVVTNRHGSLEIHKRAIERQLASIAVHIQEQDAAPLPRTIFLLLEIRGSGGVSEQLEQIARILHEQGYWKPRGRVQNYRRPDVYQLGKSVQRLFDDYAVLDRCVRQLHVRLGPIKKCRQIESETTPQRVSVYLAAARDEAWVQGEIDAMVELLEHTSHPGWFERLFVHSALKKKWTFLCPNDVS